MGAEVMNNHDQDNGLAISTPDPRAVTGKNACAAPIGVKSVPDPFLIVADQAQESAPQVSSLRQNKKISRGAVDATTNDACFCGSPLSVSGEGITDTIFKDNPRPSIDGFACAIPPGAHLTGGGISNRPQSFSFQSGHALSHKLASSFPGHSQIASSGSTP
jgi:hypothetical protein